jgi:phosphopantothenoylcysteine decarboxylase/phosphopantothenate--cysteine ligase
MHTEMWEHPSVRENLATLERRGVGIIVPPEVGRLAGGDSGEGRWPIRRHRRPGLASDRWGAGAGRGDLAGLHVVVSAGGTREALDPVRFLTNRSSGKQGHAWPRRRPGAGGDGDAGHRVSPLALPPDVGRGDPDRRGERGRHGGGPGGRPAEEADVVIMAAAVADFRPKVAAERKLSKEDGLPELVLEPTPDILAGLVARRRPGQVLVGFAAETNDVARAGPAQAGRKGVDLLVVNDVSAPGPDSTTTPTR